MADVITRLKVDSSEYDSKVKRAAEGILNLERTIREAGESFLATWKDEQNFVKGLGQMETVSKTARGKISELTSAFTEMSLVYKRMTDEEKNSPFGKNLSASLDQLKGRIADAKKDLADVNKELGETGRESQSTGNILDQLAGKFGISTKALMGWGAAIGAGTTALKVAKDAFFASEQNIDGWGRTVESSKMLYEGFLTALNTGDIGGYLQNMDNIAQAAREAYNALDLLNTTKTINAPATSGRQTEISRLQGMLRTNRATDSLTGGKSYATDGAVLTQEQRQQVANDLKALLKESRDVAKQEIDRATDAINALYREQAAVLGMSEEEFRKGTATMAAFEANLEKARKAQEWEAQHTTSSTMSTSAGVIRVPVRDNSINPNAAYQAWSVFKDDGPMFQKIIQEIQKRDQATQQFYGLVNQSYRGINRAEGVRVGGTGSTTPQTDQEKAQAKYDQAQKDYSQALEAATLAVKSGQADTVAAKKKELSAAESLWKAIGDAREIYDSEELKKAQEDAAKKVVELGGSVNALIEEQKKAQEAARELTAAQKKAAEANRKMADALAANDYKAYSAAYKQYQTAKADVQRLGGEMPKLDGKKIVYTVEVDDKQLAKLKDLQTDDKTIKINVEEGRVNLPLLPKDDETIHFNVEPGEVNLPDIPKEFDQTVNTKVGDVELPDIPKIYTVTIEAETYQAVRNIDAAVADMNSMKVEIPVSVEKPDPVEVPVNMSYTDTNLSAFIGNLKQELSQAPLGTTLYQNLTAQLADANMLANLMQFAVKNGIDIAQFDPQGLFNKIFGENPGDYIDNAKWEELRKKIEELVGKPITIDVNTGTVNVGGKTTGSKTDGQKDFNSLINNVSNITRSLEQLGVEIPEGFAKTISIMQIISSLITTISSMTAAQGISGALSNIPIVGGVLGFFGSLFGFQNGGVVHAANGFSGIVPGNSFSGDNIPAMLNAGETVLTRAQSGVIASALNGIENGGNVSRPMATIESDQIRIVLQNGAQAKGMTLGEYLGLN